MGRERMMWCVTCDHGYINDDEWNFDARMCKECALCLN